MVFFLYLGAVVQKRVKLFPGAAWVCDDVMNDNGADRAFSNWRRIFFVELRQRLTIALTRVYCYILPTRSTAPYATCSIRQSTLRTRPTQYRATSPPPPQYRYTELATIVLKNARLRFDLSGLNRLFFLYLRLGNKMTNLDQVRRKYPIIRRRYFHYLAIHVRIRVFGPRWLVADVPLA